MVHGKILAVCIRPHLVLQLSLTSLASAAWKSLEVMPCAYYAGGAEILDASARQQQCNLGWTKEQESGVPSCYMGNV